MKFGLTFSSLIVSLVANFANAQSVNHKGKPRIAEPTTVVNPRGTGRVGSAEVGKTPKQVPTSNPFFGIFGRNECQNRPKVFTITDKDTTFKNIVYADGKLRIESNSGEPLEINCRRPKKGSVETKNWLAAKQTNKKMVIEHILDLNSGKNKREYTLTNKNEIPVESLVNVYAPADEKRGATVVLKYKNWNGKSLQIDCPSAEDDFRIEVSSREKIYGGYQIKPVFKGDPIVAPPPPDEDPKDPNTICPAEYYKFDMANGTIDVAPPNKSVTLPYAFPDSKPEVGRPLEGGVR
jgi:hypothetical protein